jgi:hypothetical protein
LKNTFFLLIIIISYLQACTTETEQNTVKPKVANLKLFGKKKDSVIVGFNASKVYLVRPAALWQLSDPKGGTIDSTGLLTTGTTEGLFTLRAANKAKAGDTLSIK